MQGDVGLADTGDDVGVMRRGLAGPDLREEHPVDADLGWLHGVALPIEQPLLLAAALVAALQDGRLGGAGLDVFDPEPPAGDNPLFQLDNVVLTPHLASFTEEGRQRMGMMVAEDVLRVLRGEKPVYPANSDVINKILDKE